MKMIERWLHLSHAQGARWQKALEDVLPDCQVQPEQAYLLPFEEAQSWFVRPGLLLSWRGYPSTASASDSNYSECFCWIALPSQSISDHEHSSSDKPEDLASRPNLADTSHNWNPFIHDIQAQLSLIHPGILDWHPQPPRKYPQGLIVSAGAQLPESHALCLCWPTVSRESTSGGLLWWFSQPVSENTVERMETPGPLSSAGSIIDRMRHLPVVISVRLAARQITLSQLLSMTPGSLLIFDKSHEDWLDLYVNNVLLGRGEAVKIGEKFGLRIMELGVEAVRPSRLLRG